MKICQTYVIDENFKKLYFILKFKIKIFFFNFNFNFFSTINFLLITTKTNQI